MKNKRKICVVITARSSYSRIKTALKAIQEHNDLELQLVITGSALLDRYGLAVDYIEKDGFKIDEKVFIVLEGENPTSMAKSTGLGLLELSNVFYNLKPDAVVSVADRFETIATSIASAYQNIPLAHIQGGEISGNIDEKVRHAITKLADIHLVASDKARERVIRMGEDPDYVFNTGCPSIDIAAEVIKDPRLDFDPFEKYVGVGEILDLRNGYIVIMQHPVTTEYQKARDHISMTLNSVHKLDLPALWFWPNVDAGTDGTSKGIRVFRELHKPKNIHFFKNMNPNDFLKLLYNSKCLVGNSSVGIRECSYLGVPVVNIGSRQNGRDRGSNVYDVGYNEDEIMKAVETQVEKTNRILEKIYGDGDAGKKIADILGSVTLRIEKTLNYK